MGITAKKGAQRELVPSGMHPARCIKLYHFGHVPKAYKGEMQIKNIVRIVWELPTEMRVFDTEKGEQPMSISKDYTLSLGNKANLKKDLESWRGKGFTVDELEGFDITNLISAPCMLNVIHDDAANGNTYANIAGVTPLLKGYECPEQINPSFIWDYDDNYDDAVLANMHEWFRDRIKSSLEYQEKMTPPDVQNAPMPTAGDDPGEVNDDLPF